MHLHGDAMQLIVDDTQAGPTIVGHSWEVAENCHLVPTSSGNQRAFPCDYPW